nr:hypothetical protein [Tanacetum cinerariifolium]
GNGRIDGQGGQVGGQGSDVNDGVDGVLDFSTIIAQQLRNLLPTIVTQVGDQGRGQGNVMRCRSWKLSYEIMSWSRLAMLRILIGSMSWLDPRDGGGNGTLTIQKAIQIAGRLTDEALRNGSIKKNTEKRGNGGEPSKDRNVRDDNKRSRTVNPFSTTLFDSGANYSFVSTTFIPLLGIVPSDLGFSYETEITSGQLLEIDKVIRGCKLEIEDHVFDINLIPFGSESFDMIIGMDWLSNHKADIIRHHKVVRIPLPDGKVLRVIGERPEEKMRHLVSAKAKEQIQEEMVVVRDFHEVFLDDLSGLPPSRKIEFQIELAPGAIPVMKYPYRLAPSKMEELSGQLKELQDKGFIQPSSSPWGAPVLFVKKKDDLMSRYHQLRVHEDDILKIAFRTHYGHFEFTYFSNVDLMSGYHQLRVHEDDILKIAFRTHYGHFEFTVMPFGLTNAPAVFMDLINRVQFLRHVINGDGIHVVHSKIEAVKSREAPITPYKVCLFLGLARYYRRFIKNFSKIAKPLTVLTQKSKNLEWGDEQENAFQTLKGKLCVLG